MIKYKYKGQTLRSYCKKNNINYDRVVKRIKIKKMTVSQAVKEPKINYGYLICSDGIPLKNKCKTMSQYRGCLWRIAHYGKNTDNCFEPIDRCKARTIHFFNGKSFKEICGEDELKYKRACYRLRKGYSKQVALFGTKWDLIYG